MSVEVKIPEVGESITEGFLVEWSRADGEIVAVDDTLLVLETDKITMNVGSEVAGRLTILVEAGATVEVGQVVATVDTTVAAAAPAPPQTAADSSPVVEPTTASAPVRGLSPAVQRLVQEHDIDPSRITGSGKDGRILKSDVIQYLEKPVAAPSEPEAAAVPPPPTTATGPEDTQLQTRTPMSRLRQRLAERLVEVQQTAAILTTFNEVDMSRVMELRSRYKDAFKKRHDIGLGFMSFFVKASVDALKTVPEVNSFIDGSAVVTNHYYDIGVAVSSDSGLVVPVVRDADRRSIANLERGIADLARRARERTLELSDLSGGVFTISNGGVFGSMLSTPILNPPQSAILGMHAIKKRPVVVNDEIVIRPMMNLALSYDHRLIDGREAVTFLRRIVECLENPERLLLEV